MKNYLILILFFILIFNFSFKEKRRVEGAASLPDSAQREISVERPDDMEGEAWRRLLNFQQGYHKENSGVEYDFTYGHLSSEEFLDLYQPVKDDPHIFRVWKDVAAEPLIKRSLVADFDASKNVEGVYCFFDLRSKPTVNVVDGWNVRVSGSNYGEDNWVVSLTASDTGGLIFAEDNHLNLAPTSGYIQELVISSKDLKNSWDRPQFNCYYESPGGSMYASFKLRLEIGGKKKNDGSRKDFRVIIDSLKINPNASRNLQFDSAKRIR